MGHDEEVPYIKRITITVEDSEGELHNIDLETPEEISPSMKAAVSLGAFDDYGSIKCYSLPMPNFIHALTYGPANFVLSVTGKFDYLSEKNVSADASEKRV